jgi:hypothetical protein
VSNLSKEIQELSKQIKTLNKNIDILIKVTAVNIGKDEIFKGKEKKEEKIEILDKMGLPRNIIAIITGSTPDSISAIRSKRKLKQKVAHLQQQKEGS